MIFAGVRGLRRELLRKHRSPEITTLGNRACCTKAVLPGLQGRTGLDGAGPQGSWSAASASSTVLAIYTVEALSQ